MSRQRDRERAPSGVVTFLFTDIEGSTPLWDLHEAAMATALERHDLIIEEVVGSHAGRVLRMKGEGDSSLSVFEAAADAAHAAVAIQRRFRAEPWPEPISISVRMSLHTGEAQFRAGAYYGPAVNRGARVRDLAAGEQIFVSRSTASLIAQQVPPGAELVELGHRRLLGLTQGEDIFALRWESVEDPRPRRTKAWSRPPLPSALVRDVAFVGRSAEMEALEAALDAVRRDQQRTVLVSGEPGVGKTGLAAAIGHRAYERGASVLYGWCDEAIGIPYQPFLEPLRECAAAIPPGSMLDRMGGRIQPLWRLLPELRTEAVADDRSPVVASETDRFAMFEGVTALLREVARRSPVVLVLDDLHWADRPTQALLKHVIASDDIGGLLVVGTFRDTEQHANPAFVELLADLRRESAVERLALGGLEPAEVDELLHAFLERLDDDTRALARVLHSPTGGNPFFIREIVRHLHESGVLDDPEGSTTLRLDLDDSGLPASIREVVGRRLLRLTDSARRALKTAAVVGPTFSFAVLERVPDAGSDPSALLDALDEATSAGLIRETVDGFAFSHALVRQTILSQTSGVRIARLHERIADAMEALPDPSIEALAHHYLEASAIMSARKAATYALEAGVAAYDGYAFDDAAMLFRRGLEALARSPDPDLVLRAQLRWHLGLAVWDREGSLGGALLRDAAADAYEASSPEMLARIAGLVASHEFAEASDSETSLIVERALELAETGDLSDLAIAQAASAQHIARVARDSERAVEVARSAVETARRSDDRYAIVDALGALGLALMGTPSAEERVQVSQEIVEMHTEAAAMATAMAMTRQVTALFELCRRDDVEDAIEGLRTERALNWEGAVTLHMTDVSLALLDARFEDAERRAQHLLTDYPDHDLALLLATAAILLIRREQGRFAEVRAVLAAGTGQYPSIGALRAANAAFSAELGMTDDAASHLDALIADDLAAVRRDMMWPAALGWLAEAAASLSQPEHAATLVQHLAPFSGLIVVLPWDYACLGAADRFLGMLLSLQGEHGEAERHFDAAVALERGLRSPTVEARTALWFARSIGRARPGDSRRIDILSGVIESAHRLGMTLVADHARGELARARE